VFLKFRYRLGYEALCAEVSDSISWRRFCRIPIAGKVPHPTTLMKLTTRCGSGAVAGLNEALWAKAAGAKLLRTSRLRADTTVVPANVAYPTDCGLLARAITRIAATGARVQAAGGATRTRMRDRSRAAGRRAHAIGPKLRSRAAQAAGGRQAVHDGDARPIAKGRLGKPVEFGQLTPPPARPRMPRTSHPNSARFFRSKQVAKRWHIDRLRTGGRG
jgi:IS5 family transposase